MGEKIYLNYSYNRNKPSKQIYYRILYNSDSVCSDSDQPVADNCHKTTAGAEGYAGGFKREC